MNTKYKRLNYEWKRGYNICKYSAYNVNIWPSASYSSIWEKQKHTNAIVKAKMGEDGVLAEYLPVFITISVECKELLRDRKRR